MNKKLLMRNFKIYRRQKYIKIFGPKNIDKEKKDFIYFGKTKSLTFTIKAM